MAFFDIVIPTYRRPAELAQALQSVQQQTFQDWACWIAEDGESAETRDAVQPFLSDSRFHYLPGPHAGRPSVPRNRAIRSGQAPWIAFLDDDDCWMPDKLEKQAAFLSQHPACILVSSNARLWNGAEAPKASADLLLPFCPTRKFSFPSLVKENLIINSSALVSRVAVERIGLLDERLNPPAYEDYNLWLRLAPLGEIWILEDALVYYRILQTQRFSQNMGADVGKKEQARVARTMRDVFQFALDGVPGADNLLRQPENEAFAAACQAQVELFNQQLQTADAPEQQPVSMGSLLRSLKNKLMLATFGTVLDAFLKKRNLTLVEQNKFAEISNRAKYFSEFQVARANAGLRAARSPHCAECVIFSKDRALQLHALLASMLELTTPALPIYVLYHASTPAHLAAYDTLRKLFANQPLLRFTKQSSSFREDVLEILEGIEAPRVFFLVDDIVFTAKTDLADFVRFDPDVFVPTLRMGLNVTRSYTMQQPLSTPDLFSVPGVGADKIVWHWEQGMHDWAYPLSVDGHFFATWEMREMARRIDFKAPNSFEAQLQTFNHLFLCRAGVASQTSHIVNIACNKVQDENENICGDVHQDALLQKWLDGYQMDYRALTGFVSESPHAEVAFALKRREP